MAFKLIMSVQGKWRKLDGANRMPEIIEAIEFKDGIKQLTKAAKSHRHQLLTIALCRQCTLERAQRCRLNWAN